jgi:hypothetical protein
MSTARRITAGILAASQKAGRVDRFVVCRYARLVALRRKRPGDARGDAEIVEMAWQSLPPAHRRLLESIGASQREIISEPLGDAADAYRKSAGLKGLTPSNRAKLNPALAVWIKDLRLVLINGGHPKLDGLDAAAREQFIAHLAWHEWAHALSVERCSREDLAAGARLLELAPPGVREVIREAGYGSRDYTHEVIAETYAVLMTRRLREGAGQPPWLDDEIYSLLRRVTEWSG